MSSSQNQRIIDNMDQVAVAIEGILRSSVKVLPENPSTEELKIYSRGLSNLSFALDDIDRARANLSDILHRHETEGGE